MQLLSKTLSMAQPVIEVAPDYFIKSGTDSFIVLKLSFTGAKAEEFGNLPNVWEKRSEKLEFKHERRNGTKYWTTKLGVSLFFVVPKSVVYLHEVAGYSFPKVRINQENLTLNVVGGTSPKGWTDYVSGVVETVVNLPAANVSAVASVSLTAEEASAAGASKALIACGYGE